MAARPTAGIRRTTGRRDSGAHAPLSVPRPLVALLALACGLAVANVYYAQPLLDAIARQLGIGSGTAGLIVTFSQLGYAAGLLLLVPLGDLLNRRRLVATMLFACAGALLLVAGAPSFALVGGAIAAVGFTSVVSQVLIPFAATLADDRDRGRVVGYVMTGLLLGTLLSRTAAGLVAQVAGWRAVYLGAAALTTGLALLLLRALPAGRPPAAGQRYLALLGSPWRLLAQEPVLRLRAAYGALSFGGLNVLWTPVAFLLARPPYRFGEAAIGLFALLTVPLAFTTGTVGRFADRGHVRRLTGVSNALVLLGAGLAALGVWHLWALAGGALLVTLGTQSLHITNQSEIYRLQADARSRITSAYMTVFFAGGVAGSALSAAAYERSGWAGVCGLLAAVGLIGLVIWALEHRRSSPASPSRGSRATR